MAPPHTNVQPGRRSPHRRRRRAPTTQDVSARLHSTPPLSNGRVRRFSRSHTET
ncbi:hypothetical protein I551_1600 [Mycobacterium ulcerans str. Harvey]|uniref:Uncharacterized protein n=1 Tax=Mycobacterium ulcerans str. Harvey TaxID=1299332 RepID=A0ABP3APT1_MYCUL|nr:hypothetical protein I551_1600 [Mycobacterium ulcerans str. Harvey]